MAILERGETKTFELSATDGPLMANISRLLEGAHLTQGYIITRSGILNDMTCAFFLTRHKPSPTFGKASFMGKNKVLNMSGFFLSIPNPRAGASNSIIVPHVHVVFQNKESGKIFSGHFVDALLGEFRFDAVPLLGATLKRETDPNTGGMYLRTDKRNDINPKGGDSILFSLGPGEDFPNELFKRLSEKRISKAEFSFAIGTLQLAHLKNSHKVDTVMPKEGLELTHTSGDIFFEDGKCLHKTSVHLTDRYGNQYTGLLQASKVKDLVEGILVVEG
ncbi:MAG: PCC domain-containing protein [Nitrososphaeria archaeon]